MLTRTIEALDRVNRVLSDQNIKTFSATLSDAQAVTAELRERKAIIADAQKLIQDIDTAAQQRRRASSAAKQHGRHRRQAQREEHRRRRRRGEGDRPRPARP